MPGSSDPPESRSFVALAASLASLGLDGDVGPEGARECGVLTPPPVPGPLEAWAFRAGRKPVVFLTVRPGDVAPTLTLFPGAHVERRDRRVHVEAQDRWIDRRDVGEPRVELYVSRDAALALEACALQETDPTRALPRLGALMGYPPCCVDAFGKQRNRSNNTANRYATRARTGPGPWFFELNNLPMMVAPFFPCSYRCEPARDFAHGTLEALRATHPASATAVEALLRRPVLYFDSSDFITFDGTLTEPARIAYTRTFVPHEASPRLRRLARTISTGDALTFDDHALSVTRAGAPRFELRRVEPQLGFVANFV
jgi:hypothetical protein